MNSWRARVIAAIVFCTTLIAGTAALIKNIQIIKEFVGIGKSFSMPSGDFAQEMAIWLFRPNYMMGEYDGRLILSCDQAVSAPLTFPSHMPR